MKQPLPRMEPVYWLLLAIWYGAAGLVGGWVAVAVLFPLAASAPGIIYYPAEDEIFTDNLFESLECDAEHRLTDTIPLDPPTTFKQIRANILFVCDKPGEEQKWIYTLTTVPEIQAALDHIEQLALHRDRKFLGILGLVAILPIAFSLAGAFMNRKQE